MKNSKLFCFVLVFLMIINSVVLAESNEDSGYFEKTFDSVSEGNFTVVFDKNIPRESIVFNTDLIEYINYDAETNIYTFNAKEDLKDVTIKFKWKKESGENQHHLDGGDSSIGQSGGSQSSGRLRWEEFGKGKQGWEQPGGRILYSIKIDFTDDVYEGIDKVVLYDVGSEGNRVDGEIEIRYHHNDGGYVSEPSMYKISADGNYFWEVELEVDRSKKVDIYYHTNPITNVEDVTNSYKIYTLEQWEKIISEGVIGGYPDLDKDDEVKEPEDPGSDPIQPEPTDPESVEPDEPAPVEPTEPEIPEEEDNNSSIPEIDISEKKPDNPDEEDIKEDESNDVNGNEDDDVIIDDVIPGDNSEGVDDGSDDMTDQSKEESINDSVVEQNKNKDKDNVDYVVTPSNDTEELLPKTGLSNNLLGSKWTTAGGLLLVLIGLRKILMR